MTTNAKLGQDGKPHRLCRDCSPPHVENCGICFGYGIAKGEAVEGRPTPLAGEDIDLVLRTGDWEHCPECDGTPNGIADGLSEES